jgi:hypothetical protein
VGQSTQGGVVPAHVGELVEENGTALVRRPVAGGGGQQDDRAPGAPGHRHTRHGRLEQRHRPPEAELPTELGEKLRPGGVRRWPGLPAQESAGQKSPPAPGQNQQGTRNPEPRDDRRGRDRDGLRGAQRRGRRCGRRDLNRQRHRGLLDRNELDRQRHRRRDHHRRRQAGDGGGQRSQDRKGQGGQKAQRPLAVPGGRGGPACELDGDRGQNEPESGPNGPGQQELHHEAVHLIVLSGGLPPPVLPGVPVPRHSAVRLRAPTGPPPWPPPSRRKRSARPASGPIR